MAGTPGKSSRVDWLIRQLEHKESIINGISDALMLLDADSVAVGRMLRNLVDNALKYGGNALTEIRIAYKESDGFHILCVNDNGVGVKKENAERIFDPFERSVPFQEIEGAGLGLAIVKEIAAQHVGKVWMAPREEKGTTFCVAISKDLEPSAT